MCVCFLVLSYPELPLVCILNFPPSFTGTFLIFRVQNNKWSPLAIYCFYILLHLLLQRLMLGVSSILGSSWSINEKSNKSIFSAPNTTLTWCSEYSGTVSFYVTPLVTSWPSLEATEKNDVVFKWTCKNQWHSFQLAFQVLREKKKQKINRILNPKMEKRPFPPVAPNSPIKFLLNAFWLLNKSILSVHR